jgi:hypothetical protein
LGGGAWPFLVGGVICLVNSVNERDLILLNNIILYVIFHIINYYLKRLFMFNKRKFEAITGL